MALTKEDRDRMRHVQDRFLACPLARHLIGRGGWGAVAGLDDRLTFADVRDFILPEWEAWFKEFLEGEGR